MLTILIAIGLTITLMGLNAATVKVGVWYDELNKPSWNPPKWAFAPAWTVILSLVAWAGVLAWNGSPAPEDRLRLVILFAVNLLLNGLWSQIFFNLRRPALARPAGAVPDQPAHRRLGRSRRPQLVLLGLQGLPAKDVNRLARLRCAPPAGVAAAAVGADARPPQAARLCCR